MSADYNDLDLYFLQEENQFLVPDNTLALVTGKQPFKLAQIITVLMKTKSIVLLVKKLRGKLFPHKYAAL